MLKLYRAERSDTLVSALATLLRTPPLSDPFARETVAVPAKGVERWLNQRLSSQLGTSGPSAVDGISANIAFPSPARLVAESVAAVSGITADDDPWSPTRLVWTVLDVIDESLGEPWCGVLAKHLEGHREGRRFASATHVTELFRSYAAQRPQMLIDWAAGRLTDGHGLALSEDFEWQARLWCIVADKIDVPGARRATGGASEPRTGRGPGLGRPTGTPVGLRADTAAGRSANDLERTQCESGRAHLAPASQPRAVDQDELAHTASK